MQRACHRHLSGFQVQEPLREYRRFLADHLHWVFTESVINDCVRNTVQWFIDQTRRVADEGNESPIQTDHGIGRT